MKTYTVTDKQVSALHNGMCAMYRLRDMAQDMFKKDSMFNQLMDDAFKYIEPVKKELMDKKDADFDRINNLADEYAKQHNLKKTRWSIYDINHFLESSNVPAGAIIVAPWDTRHSVVVESNSEYCSWIELWKAVEKLAVKTIDDDGYVGFGDHVFIEKFTKVKDKENTYEVFLGS